MNILFVSYWNLSDPLTVSTVFPNLKVLCDFPWIEKIVFINVERGAEEQFAFGFKTDKIIYKPYLSRRGVGLWIEKFYDYTEAPDFIVRLCKEYSVRVVIARGSPAGALAYLAWRKTKVPFLVESFEPHADYMREPGIWKWYDPRYFISRWLEQKQKRFAAGLMPVAFNYTHRLTIEGIPEKKIRTVPCSVDNVFFSFSYEKRVKTRKKLRIGDQDIVGIYIGRFGGLYMHSEAFDIYKSAFSYFGNKLFLIILTPSEYHDWVSSQWTKHELPHERLFLAKVPYHDVPLYLSASDFGLATYSPGKSKAYLSPVKIGEYWANGLPIMLTNGVGDETHLLLENSSAGVLFEIDKIYSQGNLYFSRLETMLRNGQDRSKLAETLLKHREIGNVEDAYRYFLSAYYAESGDK